MKHAADPALRVLLVAPTAKDCELSAALLDGAGLPSRCFTDLEAAYRELDQGVGVLVLPEELVTQDASGPLLAWLRRQPSWSDLPMIVMARAGTESAVIAEAIDLLGNVTVLERPMRVATLISALHSGLRARARQYQLRNEMSQRERHMQALREADRRKDEFLATLAHELRNPLAPISSSVHALRLRLDGQPEIERLTGIIDRQVKHMVRLVDDLLELSRVTRGHIELRTERVGIGSILYAAVETSQPLIDASRQQLTVDVPAEPMIVNGDPVRLAQVFANLLNNAAKYSTDGGHIRLSARPEGGSVVVRVSDTGPGIPADMLPRVFDLFVQVPSSAPRAQGGLGIGLTLVKNLVEMQGGTVQAHSAGPGQGSEFTVRLPLVEVAETGAAPPKSQPEPTTLRQRRVLVVDDNRDAAEALAMLLDLMNVTVRVAHNGTAALQAVRDFQPEVVLMDIGMPGMDGHEVARRLRAEPIGRDITLVALTGWGKKEDRRRSRQAGFDHHMIKPLDVRALEVLLSGVARQGASPG